jgi:hypothetical protein
MERGRRRRRRRGNNRYIFILQRARYRLVVQDR